MVSVQMVFDGIDEGSPAGFDDVFAYTDGMPGVVFIGAVDVHADACRGACLAVDNADFVVDELHCLDAGIEGGEGFSQSRVHGVDRSVSFGGLYADLIVDLQFEDCFGKLLISSGIEVPGKNLVFDGFEVWGVSSRATFDQKVKGGFGRFVLIALVFLFDDLGQDLVLEFSVHG